MTALVERYAFEVRERGTDWLLLAGGCLLSLVIGWKLGNDASRMPIALAALVALTAVGARAFGVAAGLLVLAALNGLPFVDLEQYAQAGSFRISDVALASLVGALLLRNPISVENARLQGWLRAARWWGFALGAWWIITVLRSTFFSGIPLLKAALFGRDFLYFALLLPLLLGGLRNRREIQELLGTLLAATVLFAFGHLALVVTGAHQASWFVHQTLSNDVGGVTRVYALMGDAVSAALPFGLALALMGPSRRLRVGWTALAVVSAASVLLQFARATYFGLFFGLLAATCVWLAQSARGDVGRRLAIVFAGLAFAGGVVFITASRSSTSTASSPTALQIPRAGLPAPAIVASRLSSGVTDLSSKSGTVAYRYELDRKLFHVLGRHWPIGLGFWHPDVKYVPNLPDGSIRNGDSGITNSLMTMGVIGTILIYLAPLAVLLAIFRRRRRKDRGREEWFFFGMFTWIAGLLVGSISLVTLFSVSGLALTAVLLACTIRLLVEHGAEANG
jgi:uncharacterized membrane protein YhaH (DUF805 family)